MKISLIISVYKDAEALDAVLRSVQKQTFTEFEVLVAQDADTDDLNKVIEKYQPFFKLQHLQQKDEGFLKNKILNQAIRQANSDKLVFLDGDCVLHPHFLKQYYTRISEGLICMGRRVMTDALLSQKMRNGESVTPGFVSLLLSQSKHVEEGLYAPWISAKHKPNPHLLGCNMGWHKQDLIKLNGFDEDYTHPGFGEDVDIEMRGLLFGLKKYSMRFKAIQYHLHHERPDREDQINYSRAKYEIKKEQGDWRCKNGLIK